MGINILITTAKWFKPQPIELKGTCRHTSFASSLGLAPAVFFFLSFFALPSQAIDGTPEPADPSSHQAHSSISKTDHDLNELYSQLSLKQQQIDTLIGKSLQERNRINEICKMSKYAQDLKQPSLTLGDILLITDKLLNSSPEAPLLGIQSGDEDDIDTRILKSTQSLHNETTDAISRIQNTYSASSSSSQDERGSNGRYLLATSFLFRKYKKNNSSVEYETLCSLLEEKASKSSIIYRDIENLPDQLIAEQRKIHSLTNEGLEIAEILKILRIIKKSTSDFTLGDILFITETPPPTDGLPDDKGKEADDPDGFWEIARSLHKEAAMAVSSIQHWNSLPRISQTHDELGGDGHYLKAVSYTLASYRAFNPINERFSIPHCETIQKLLNELCRILENRVRDKAHQHLFPVNTEKPQ